MFYAQEPEVLISGPAGTGKTRGALEKIFLCMQKYPCMRALLVRKTRASLTQSALVTLEEKVLPRGHPMLSGPNRAHRQSYQLQNGSELVIGGMDNADRIMSSEYDMVLACEATELTEEDWEKLLTRLRNGKMPYQQAIAECNPAHPGHWLKIRAQNGRMHWLHSRHKDNPILYEWMKRWTTEGRRYRMTLRRLSGVRRRRLLDGDWAAPEGLVYESLQENVLRGQPDILPAEPVRALAGIDWGWSNPAAVVVGAECRDGIVYLVEEVYQVRLATDELIARCKEIFGRWNVEMCFADKSRPELINEFRRSDINCRKAPNVSLETGIAAVETRLLSGRLKVFEGCKNLIEEGWKYQYGERPRGEDAEPLSGHDHAMDAMRYLVTGMDSLGSLKPETAEAVKKLDIIQWREPTFREV